jgi:hypothetical protein
VVLWYIFPVLVRLDQKIWQPWSDVVNFPDLMPIFFTEEKNWVECSLSATHARQQATQSQFQPLDLIFGLRGRFFVWNAFLFEMLFCLKCISKLDLRRPVFPYTASHPICQKSVFYRQAKCDQRPLSILWTQANSTEEGGGAWWTHAEERGGAL